MSTQDLETEVQRQNDVTIVAIKGALADEGILKAREVLHETLGTGVQKIAIEMQGVNYVSSSGIGMLVSVLKKAHQANIDLALCGLQSDIQELFQLTRLDQVFSIARDVDTWRKTLA